jgi:hypothetical protein
LNSLHEARQAFIESEAAELIRRALRCKIRASQQVFKHGDIVYYKREGYDRWLGPANVVFQDGKVIFLRHGGVFVRVSPNRLVKAGEEFTAKEDEDRNEAGDINIQMREEISRPPVTEVFGHRLNHVEVPECGEGRGHVENNDRATAHDQVEDHETVKLKKDDKITYQLELAGEWSQGKILGRAGKATGKYSDWYNVKDKNNGEERSVDFGNVAGWRMLENESEDEEVNIVTIPRHKHGEEKCVKAKQVELEKYKIYDTYEEVKENR